MAGQSGQVGNQDYERQFNDELLKLEHNSGAGMSKQTPGDQGKNPYQEEADAEQTREEEQPQSADTADADESAIETDLEQLLAKLTEAEEDAQRAKDDLLRVQAEMQNLRRRTTQDIEKAHKYGQEKFSTELLAVIDNLERSLTVASESEDEAVKAIHEGVDLTLKGLVDCFEKFNIAAVDPLGAPFDPLLHQAITTQDNPEVEPNTVIAVMQKGYTLHGRVIRPAMVIVSK